MFSERAWSERFYPQIDCDSAIFPPLKRLPFSRVFSAETAPFLPKLSAETAPFRFTHNCRNPFPGKGFQRPRARDKKLTTQEVNYIQVVGGSQPVENSAVFLCGGDPHTSLQGWWNFKSRDYFNDSTPQTTRTASSERKSRGREPRFVISRLVRRRLRGRVFAAEEGLVEGVNPGVDRVDPQAQGVDPGVQAAFHGVDASGQEGEQRDASPQDGNDYGDGVRVHGVNSTTLTPTNDE